MSVLLFILVPANLFFGFIQLERKNYSLAAFSFFAAGTAFLSLLSRVWRTAL